jgi:predicted DNA-binding transcriptional regulator YafY
MKDQPQHEAGSARRDDELTGTERLVLAILDHRVVRLRYQDRERTVEPHLLGIHEAGEPMLVAYQTGGASQRGDVPGWRTFITTSVEDVDVTDEHFPGARADLDIEAHPMIEIFARA